MAEFLALGLGQPVPLPGPVDRAELVAHLHDVRRIHRELPVDPLGGVPLLVLAALVQVEQPATAVVIFPVEAGGAGGRHIPRARRDFSGVVVVGAHGGSPDAWRDSRPASLLLSSLRERKGRRLLACKGLALAECQRPTDAECQGAGCESAGRSGW